jgi:hypothetical protein
MKNVFKTFAGLLIALFTLSSCSTLKVAFPTSYTDKVGKTALISTYIDLQKPVLPLLDAAVINGKTNSISSEITSMFIENVKIVRENVAKLLMENLNCEVIYGDDLHNMSGFKSAKATYNIEGALMKNDNNFPEIAADIEDIHPFQFENGKVVAFFKKPANYKSVISGICQKLQVNNLAVSFTLLITAPGSIYYRSSVGNTSYIYLFNQNGDCIASGSNITPAIPFKAGEVEGYQLSLDKQSETIQQAIEKIAKKYKN